MTKDNERDYSSHLLGFLRILLSDYNKRNTAISENNCSTECFGRSRKKRNIVSNKNTNLKVRRVNDDKEVHAAVENPFDNK